MWLHYIGSGGALFVLLYVIIDLFEKKKLTVNDVVSRGIIIGLLFIILLRT